MEATIKTLATKDDLRKEISDIRKEMAEGFSDLRKKMGESFVNFHKQTAENFVNFHKQTGEDIGKLYREIAERQENNIKWMFVFWIGQVAATVGTILLFIKK